MESAPEAAQTFCWMELTIAEKSARIRGFDQSDDLALLWHPTGLGNPSQSASSALNEHRQTRGYTFVGSLFSIY
jgi:hypothetical protein